MALSSQIIFLSYKATIQRKRESMELFKSSKNGTHGEEDSSIAKLLRERSSIAASMKSINDVIRCDLFSVVSHQS